MKGEVWVASTWPTPPTPNRTAQRRVGTFSVRPLGTGRNGCGAFWNKAMSDELRPLMEQLAGALVAALEADGVTQADLARQMGLTAKHVNHMVNGKSGALGMYDFAAFTLGRRWVVTLAHSDAFPPASNGTHGPETDLPTSPESH